MPRRKHIPQRADEKQQQTAAWSMLDLHHDRQILDDSSGVLLGGSAEPCTDLLGGPVDIQPSCSLSLSSHEEAMQGGPITEQEPVKRFVSIKDAKKAKKKAKSNQVTDEQLDQLLQQCHFHVSVKRELSSDVVCEIGCFCVHLKCATCPSDCECEIPEELPGGPEFWFYHSSLPDGNLVYFENVNLKHSSEPSVLYYKCTTDLPQHLAKCLDNAKFIDIHCAKYSGLTKTLYLTIKLKASAVRELEFASEAPQHIKGGLTNKRGLLAPLVQHYHGSQKPDFDYTDLTFDRKQNVFDLYRAVKGVQDRGHSWSLGLNVQHPSLKPTLRPYQCQGVRWMLYREGYGRRNKEPERLHPLFEEIVFPGGLSLYFNRYTSVFTRTRPRRRAAPSGGILADEMGLGKTVEVLACVLINPRMDLPSPGSLPRPLTCTGKLPSDQSPVKLRSPSPSTKSLHLPAFMATPSLTVATPITPGPANTINGSHATPTNQQATPTLPQATPYPEVKEEMDCVSNVSDASTILTTSQEDTSRSSASTNHDSQHSHKFPDPRDNPRKLDPGTDTCEEIVQILESEHLTNGLDDHFIIDSEMIVNGGCVEIETSGHQSESPIVVDDSDSETITDFPRKKKKRKRRWVGATRSRKKSRGEVKTSVKRSSKDRKSYYVYEPVVEAITETKYELNRFECLCGMEDDDKDRRLRIQCGDCGLWQHADCMGYDVNDSSRATYRCPHCCVQAPPLASGATLIITPSSISHQWVDEILKHIITEGIRVLVYEGNFRQLKSGQRQYIQPYTLANQDMVITSYETLRREINYVDLPHSNSEQGRRFRNPKRFMAIPSPITAVQWWRICLDEAQMVETTTTKAAEMVLRLSAVHRWCVTGTPLQHSVSDLYGLFLFLGLDPFWVKHWWYKLLYEPYCYGIQQPMDNVVADVMRRTMKNDVIDQIDIPAQTDQTHWLQFSPIEELFYRQQYERCRDEALRKLGKIKIRNLQTKLSDLDQNTVHSLLYPLVRLRQACCHPQAVRGAFLPLNRTTMTMSQVLEQLLKKTKLECEERHRELVASLNGLAGLHIIRGDYVRASETYREVLLSVNQHRNKLRTDELQQLHALHNLHQLLEQKHRGMGRTITDDCLSKRADGIRHKYLEKADSNVENAQQTLRNVQDKKKQSYRDLKSNGREWWCDVISSAERVSRDSELIEKVKNDLAEGATSLTVSIGRQFRDLRGLQFVLSNKIKDLDHHYDKLVKSLHIIETSVLVDLIPQTAECCLRPHGEVQNTCLFCQSHRQFETYESRLFLFAEKGLVTNDDGDSLGVETKRQGTWADSEVERTLKTLLTFTKQCKPELVEAGQSHVKLLEMMKKEFKCLRSLWMTLRERISSHDELSMATTRLRLRQPHQPSDPHNRSIIEITEVQPLEQKLKSDGTVANCELKKKLGQLLYIGNLEKSLDFEDGENPEQCPVCQCKLGQKWAVSRCGHCYCTDCIQLIVGRYSCGPNGRYIKCAVCRGTNLIAEISYVTTKQHSPTDDHDDLDLRGDHSSKVTAVVRCLRRLQLHEPDVKCLVFSNWVDVLQILAKALDQNGVSYRLLAGPKFQTSLTSFLHDEDVRVLLLPVHSGANGLNLIRATHVLLCEPILNPAQELQAIGRVHRIGQTKETFVHRFVVKSTIEERMSTVLKRTEDSSVELGSHDEDNMTLGDLYSLFQTEVDNEEVS